MPNPLEYYLMQAVGEVPSDPLPCRPLEYYLSRISGALTDVGDVTGEVGSLRDDLEQEILDRKAYDQEQDLKLQTLNGHYFPLGAYDFGKSLDVKTPADADVLLLTTYAITNILGASGIEDIREGTVVKNLYDGVEFVWNSLLQTWQDWGVGNIVTAGNDHLGVVEGVVDPGDGSRDGMVTVLPGGTMEALGVSALKTAVGNKVDKNGADRLMTADEATKLSGIAEGAEVNPGAATTSAAGLMSSADKSKLDDMAKTTQIRTFEGTSTNPLIDVPVGDKTVSINYPGWFLIDLGRMIGGSNGGGADGNTNILNFDFTVWNTTSVSGIFKISAEIRYSFVTYGNGHKSIVADITGNGHPSIFQVYLGSDDHIYVKGYRNTTIFGFVADTANWHRITFAVRNAGGVTENTEQAITDYLSANGIVLTEIASNNFAKMSELPKRYEFSVKMQGSTVAGTWADPNNNCKGVAVSDGKSVICNIQFYQCSLTGASGNLCLTGFPSEIIPKTLHGAMPIVYKGGATGLGGVLVAATSSVWEFIGVDGLPAPAADISAQLHFSGSWVL